MTIRPLSIGWILSLGLALGAGPDLTARADREPATFSNPGEPHRFLRTVGGFAPAQLDALDRGEPLARVLDTDKRQIAIVGAVRIQAPRERLLARYRDVSSLKSSPVILQVGPFSTPPRVEDLQGLTFEPYDLQTIKDCSPGDCGVRLPAAAMERFRRDVDWGAPGWAPRAATLWRGLIVQYLADYLRRGTLAEYHNKEEPLSVAQEFGVLFDESRYFEPTAREFFTHLRQYPTAPLAGAEQILYWTKDTMGVRPVTSVTHLTIFALPSAAGQARRPAIVATKQIWATHYFDAGLGLTITFDDGASGFYMLCINRVRTRSLTSVMRAVVRSTVQRRSRDAMEKILQSTKAALERPR